MTANIDSINKVIAFATAIACFWILGEDIYSYVIENYYSDDTVYLYSAPLSVRINQWIYLSLFIVSAISLLIGKPFGGRLYIWSALLLITERLVVYLFFFELFYGEPGSNLILPIFLGVLVIAYFNIDVVSQTLKIKYLNKVKTYVGGTCLAIAVNIVPKLL
jgi:hypothetical protein